MAVALAQATPAPASDVAVAVEVVAAPAPLPEAPADQAAAPTAPAPTPMPADAGGSEILVTARPSIPGDPVAEINAQSFAVVQAVDKVAIGPAATAYIKTVPIPLRQGLHNVLGNLDEPIVFVNFMLQLKPGKALETAGRFAINSTLGLAGILDVAKAKPFNLPRRTNSLANTLGYYGVEPGPYLYLPLIGSTTVRDLIARPIDLALLPAAVPSVFGNPTVALGKGALNVFDERANVDNDLRRIRAENPDPYDAYREYYLRRRQAEIDFLRGKTPEVTNPDFDWQVSRHEPVPPAAAPAE